VWADDEYIFFRCVKCGTYYRTPRSKLRQAVAEYVEKTLPEDERYVEVKGEEAVTSFKERLEVYVKRLAMLGADRLREEIKMLLRQDQILKRQVKETDAILRTLPGWARNTARERLNEVKRERRRIRQMLKAALLNYTQVCDKQCSRCPFEELCLRLQRSTTRLIKPRYR